MTACKWNGRNEPRVLPGRHGADCAGETCAGCLPCAERHCGTCRRAHAEVTCPECIAATRDDLAAIRLMCGALPTEVEHRGVNGEAMMLLGPSADPEAWRNRAMSAMSGRVDAAYLDDCRDEQHPLWVLGTWEQLYREEFDHASDLTQTIERAGDYLERIMHRAAESEEVPFEDFARDVRGCRGHLEDVLRDGERPETGAPCMTCEVPLHLHRGKTEDLDRWRCPRCRQSSTVAQYLFAVQDQYRKKAEALTARDLATEYGVAEGSVRAWASEKVGKVRKRGKDQNGLQLYDVSDVLKARGEKKEVSA